MSVPINIPTDNLYKFIAIFGLIIFIFSIAYSETAITKAELQVQKVRGEVDLLEVEVKYLKEDQTDFNNEVKQTDFLKDVENDKELKQDKTDNTENFKKDNNLEYDIERAYELRNRLYIVEQELAQVENKSQFLKRTSNKIVQERKIMYGLMVFGIIMMILGFFTWYFKFQRYQDRIIKNKADKI